MAGFFDPTDPTAGGLMNGFAPQAGMPGMMGMFANPQTAGLLGMAGGLMQAAGASRLPVTNGQALGAGFQGMQQGAGNALQMQMQMAKMQSQLNPFGVGFGGPAQPQSAANPAGPVGSPVIGAANTGPMSGPSAGMGLMAGAGSPPVNPNDVAQPSAPPNGLSMFGGHTPQEVMLAGARLAAFGNPAGAEMMKIAAAADPSLTPTDITKMGTQGGLTPQQIQAANAAGLTKANSMSYRQGAGIATFGPNGVQFATTPGANGVIQMQDPNSPTGWRTMVNPGASDVIQQQAAAEAGGKAQFKVQQVWDPSANGGQGGFVNQTVANVANAANGENVPLGIQNNNFGNIKGSNGQFAKYDTPQDGVNAADGLLSTYGSKYGINTITGIANRWAPKGDGNNDPVAKAAAMAAASGVPANQPINLQDPAVRARILPALFDTETPGWRNAMNGRPAPGQGGPMASQPPLGVTPATNASQEAPSKQMATSYGNLSSADNAYQASRQMLQHMLAIAQQQGTGDTLARMLPQEYATKLNTDAAEYQKAHQNFVSLQGKALGASGTDAARETINEAVPTFDKPQAAKISGLNDQLNQLDLNHLKTQFLTPTYQQGNEKQYTTLSAGFDQNIKPEMMPVMQMSGDQQRAAVQAAIKANPSMRANYEWAFNNGLLK
jgi:hypothetical protein